LRVFTLYAACTTIVLTIHPLHSPHPHCTHHTPTALTTPKAISPAVAVLKPTSARADPVPTPPAWHSRF
jgi:hypothetical protein